MPDDRVPTVAELAEMGKECAYATDWRKGKKKHDRPVPTRWHVTQKGHDLMGQALRARALEAIARGESEWVRPPDSGRRRDAQ